MRDLELMSNLNVSSAKMSHRVTFLVGRSGIGNVRWMFSLIFFVKHLQFWSILLYGDDVEKMTRGSQQDSHVKLNLGLSMLKRYQGSAIGDKLTMFPMNLAFPKTRRCWNTSGIGYRRFFYFLAYCFLPWILADVERDCSSAISLWYVCHERTLPSADADEYRCSTNLVGRVILLPMLIPSDVELGASGEWFFSCLIPYLNVKLLQFLDFFQKLDKIE